jgi:hypothetical protein
MKLSLIRGVHKTHSLQECCERIKLFYTHNINHMEIFNVIVNTVKQDLYLEEPTCKITSDKQKVQLHETKVMVFFVLFRIFHNFYE